MTATEQAQRWQQPWQRLVRAWRDASLLARFRWALLVATFNTFVLASFLRLVVQEPSAESVLVYLALIGVWLWWWRWRDRERVSWWTLVVEVAACALALAVTSSQLRSLDLLTTALLLRSTYGSLATVAARLIGLLTVLFALAVPGIVDGTPDVATLIDITFPLLIPTIFAVLVARVARDMDRSRGREQALVTASAALVAARDLPAVERAACTAVGRILGADARYADQATGADPDYRILLPGAPEGGAESDPPGVVLDGPAVPDPRSAIAVAGTGSAAGSAAGLAARPGGLAAGLASDPTAGSSGDSAADFEAAALDEPAAPGLVRLADGDAQALRRRYGLPARLRSVAVLPAGGDSPATDALVIAAASPLPRSAEASVRTLADAVAQALDRLRLETRLRRSEQHHRLLVQRSTDAVLIVDTAGIVTSVSESAGLLGLTPEHTVGSPVTSLAAAVDRPRLRAALASHDTTAVATGPVVWRLAGSDRADRDPRYVEAMVTDLRSEAAVAGVVLHLRDVTERQQLQERLTAAAFTDPLTGLANRARFDATITRWLARDGETTGVLLIDLDGFKRVNDELGHATGDRLLQLVGRRIAAAVRWADLAARIGGDEFAVLVHRPTDIAMCRALATRLAEALATPVTLAGEPYRVRASVGVAIGGAGEAPADLVARADAAMYAAKRRDDPTPVHVSG